MQKVIIILGMHRSGTSVLTQICQSMGAYLGEKNELMSARADNPDGFFENNEIVCINEKILYLSGRKWYDLEPVNLDFDNSQIISAARELESIIRKMLQKNDIVAIKDPRIALILPLWNKVLNELKVQVDYIWEFRNPLEVADSLRRRDGYSRRHSLLLWVHYNLCILDFLKDRNYLLINYKDILGNSQVLNELSRVFNVQMNKELNEKIQQIVKPQYCHSYYFDCDIQDNKLVSDMYNMLLIGKKEETDWIKQYQDEIADIRDKYIDYDALEEKNYLEGKELIIYGAGKCGQETAKMLCQINIIKFDFCDKDIRKQGMEILGGKVLSIAEIEERKNLTIIIAVENLGLKKEIEQTLSCIKDVKLLSLFALKKVWRYSINNFTKIDVMMEMLLFHYRLLEQAVADIKDACNYPVLVYQNGKVGSSTVSKSLWESGIENAHIHRFFRRNSNRKFTSMVYGDDLVDFIDGSDDLQFLGYTKHIKNEIKGKKIITMVRDPIAVDLSTIFQWMGTGYIDRYFEKELKSGKDFLEAVLNFMLKIQNRLFDWFEEELKEVCGIDVFGHSFDREKGYSIIEECEIGRAHV